MEMTPSARCHLGTTTSQESTGREILLVKSICATNLGSNCNRRKIGVPVFFSSIPLVGREIATCHVMDGLGHACASA